MANVVEFIIRGVDQASGPVGKVSKVVGTAVRVTARLATATVAGASAVYGFNVALAASIDKQAKFAVRLGEDVGLLTQYQFVAGQAGIKTETFNMALQRMERRAGEAAAGTGEARAAIAELGIDARAFVRLPLDEKLITVNDALAKFPNQSDKLRLAFKLFDSEGVAMLQLLGGNSDAMKALAEDANFLGATMSKQLAADATKLTDETSRIWAAMKGASYAIGEQMIPMVAGLSHEFANFIASNKDRMAKWVSDTTVTFFTIGIVADQVLTSIKDGIVSTFTTKEGFQSMVDNIKAVFTRWFEIAAAALPLIGKLIWTTFKIAFESITQIGKWAWENIKAVFSDKSGPSLSDLMFGQLPKATAQARAELGSTLNDLGALALSTGGEVSSAIMGMLNVDVAAAQEQARAVIESLKLLGEVADETNRENLDNTKSFLEEFRAVHNDFLSTQLPVMQELAQSFYNTMQTAVSNFSQGIAQVLVDGANLGETLRAVFKNALKSVVAMLIQTGIQRVILASLFKVANTKQASQELARGLATTYVNAYASTAAIPVVGPTLAPGVADAARNAASIGAAAAGAAGAGLGASIGQAHSGLTYVPKEAPYLLNRAERVLSPAQNRDLTNALQSGGLGGGQITGDINIGGIHLTTTDFNNMSQDELLELVADKLVPALRKLKQQGVVAA